MQLRSWKITGIRMLLLTIGLLIAVLISPAAGKSAGIWGRVKRRPIIISPPIELVPDLQKVPSDNPWFFPDWQPGQVVDFIMGIEEIPQELRKSLAGRVEALEWINGSVLDPSDEEVLALTPAARSRVYNTLAGYRINRTQDCARRFPGRSMNDWMKGVKLSGSTRKLLDQLAYRNGNLVFFADISLLLERIENDQERFAVYKALNRTVTMQLTLQVPAKADLGGIVSYWGTGGREGEVLPVLESLQKNGGELDLIHLLPALPRKLLYCYPNASEARELMHDCHWTALNFFNAYQQKEFESDDHLQEVIADNYAIIPQQSLQFGDLVIYVNDRQLNSELVHSAVYICDDVVFTKNGTVWSSPWMFMGMKDMDDYYNYGFPIRKIYLRKKAAATQSRGTAGPVKQNDRPASIQPRE